jgi:hypothetical protein
VKHRIRNGKWPFGTPRHPELGVGVEVALTNPARHDFRMRHFFTGPVIKTELLVAWLEKHGIAAAQRFVDPSLPDDGDLDREAVVEVPEADYDRAYQLFFAEREDEL